MTAPALVAVDWGSSNFRAYRVARDGAVLDPIATADGVATIAPGDFLPAFRRLLGAWLDAHPGLPVIASGMVGSRNGWREAPYVKCPPIRARSPSGLSRSRRMSDASNRGRIWQGGSRPILSPHAA